ncbi:MAG TPA: ATPase, T2SS/T4P/T4SS family [Candidatus Goldiibacteriota bacterium]|nr:ATPase, T2SS/T4P/T4SS family [Candidatus Goldiibacteriota bacterium]HRQ43319.1 ATPase, T2SS/T4P/T4SS family [Candidatus Goldiibacteriota bacterium]
MAKRLGDLLLEENLITEDQIKRALEDQQKSGEPLGRILVRMGFITEEALYYFLAIQFGVEYVDVAGHETNPELLKLISKDTAEKYSILPYEEKGNKIYFATSEPDEHLVTKIRERSAIPLDKEIRFVISSESSIKSSLAVLYGVAPKNDMDESLQSIFKDEAGAQEEESSQNQEDSSITEESAPVIKLVNALISEAVKIKASDIHINPTPKGCVIRYRQDGVLQKQPTPPNHYKNAIVSRIKVMARLDIMEKRAAQDGRIKIKVQNKIIDLRVSVLPSIYGENVVMRILDQQNLMLDLTKLGFEQQELDLYQESITLPYGLILHTGPTGSGKTTTLYSALSTVNDIKKNIITLEDPVEYQLPGIIQVQMNSEIGLTFAAALKSCLRQDPNIMMVGEIRDAETAGIAISAALTGHLLFSTLHTNDSPSTIMRLIDMGVDRIYVGSALKMCVAQRLMRRICANCKKEYSPTDDELQRILVDRKDVEGIQFYKGEGCPKCNGSGYKGRIAIYEIMGMTPALADLIYSGADLNQLTEQAQKDGMRTLRQVALEKWKNGITSIEEVIMATSAD